MQWSRGSTDEVIERKSAEKAPARSLQIVRARKATNPSSERFQKAPARSLRTVGKTNRDSMTGLFSKALARSLQIGPGERGDKSVAGLVFESPRPVAVAEQHIRTSLQRTASVRIGVAQTTTVNAGRQPASSEVTLTARGDTARSPRSSTAHCSRNRDRAAPFSPTTSAVSPSARREVCLYLKK
jgi:hypothetical protein